MFFTGAERALGPSAGPDEKSSVLGLDVPLVPGCLQEGGKPTLGHNRKVHSSGLGHSSVVAVCHSGWEVAKGHGQQPGGSRKDRLRMKPCGQGRLEGNAAHRRAEQPQGVGRAKASSVPCTDGGSWAPAGSGCSW